MWVMEWWGRGGLLNRQNLLSMTKFICGQSDSINRHHNFGNPYKSLIQVALASKIVLQIFGIRPT